MGSADRAAFEALLAADPQRAAAAAAARCRAAVLGDFLRAHSPAPALANEDFFNAGVQARIAPAASAVPELSGEVRSWAGWSRRRLAWVAGGIAALLLVALVGGWRAPWWPGRADGDGAVILAVEAGGDGVSASAFLAAGDRVPVVWLEGLEYIPDTGFSPAHVP